MGLSVDIMLEEMAKEGYNSEEIKGAVKQFLGPYFENKSVIDENATQSNFLSMFSFVVAYYRDKSFSENLLKIIECYRNAYMMNPVQFKQIVLPTVDMMGQKENLMWTIKSNRPCEKLKDMDIYEAAYSYMKLGNC